MPALTTTHSRSSAFRGASPWTVQQRVAMVLWEFTWALLCSWTPKPLYKWRLACLRLFGAHIVGTSFVHQRTRIQIPWNLTLLPGASLGDRTQVYNLAHITVGPCAIVAQEAYLCTGSHDLEDPSVPLITSPISIEAEAFIGARAFIMPGITVGERAIVGACAVVTRDVPARACVKGNPAR